MWSRDRCWSSFILHIVCQAKESHPIYTLLENSCHIPKTPRACYKGHQCLVFPGPLVTTEDTLLFIRISSYSLNILWKEIGSVYSLNPTPHRRISFIGLRRYKTWLRRVNPLCLYFTSTCPFNAFRANRSVLVKDPAHKLTTNSLKESDEAPGIRKYQSNKTKPVRPSVVWPMARFHDSCLCPELCVRTEVIS